MSLADTNLSEYAYAFIRERGRCIYCKRDLLACLDAFAASHLDHLKPRARDGSDTDRWNRVMACSICNSLKGAFDPVPDETVTEQNFREAVQCAHEYIMSKRDGKISSSYYRDFEEWKSRLPKELAKLEAL